MKFAVVTFPGSNCDHDIYYAVSTIMEAEIDFISHNETSLTGYDALLLPGGFSFGDYLRCGALARFSPIMPAIIAFAEAGKPVFGTCNGFQILLEAGLLPGALKPNENLQFICQSAPLKVVNNETIFTNAYGQAAEITLPIAHGEGNYYCDQETLAELKANNQIVFTYEGNNPNGSVENIAGIVNKRGNVLGMMPHPERAVEALLGSTDGKAFFQSLINHLGKVTVK